MDHTKQITVVTTIRGIQTTYLAQLVQINTQNTPKKHDTITISVQGLTSVFYIKTDNHTQTSVEESEPNINTSHCFSPVIKTSSGGRISIFEKIDDYLEKEQYEAAYSVIIRLQYIKHQLVAKLAAGRGKHLLGRLYKIDKFSNILKILCFECLKNTNFHQFDIFPDLSESDITMAIQQGILLRRKEVVESLLNHPSYIKQIYLSGAIVECINSNTTDILELFFEKKTFGIEPYLEFVQNNPTKTAEEKIILSTIPVPHCTPLEFQPIYQKVKHYLMEMGSAASLFIWAHVFKKLGLSAHAYTEEVAKLYIEKISSPDVFSSVDCQVISESDFQLLLDFQSGFCSRYSSDGQDLFSFGK